MTADPHYNSNIDFLFFGMLLTCGFGGQNKLEIPLGVSFP